MREKYHQKINPKAFFRPKAWNEFYLFVLMFLGLFPLILEVPLLFKSATLPMNLNSLEEVKLNETQNPNYKKMVRRETYNAPRV